MERRSLIVLLTIAATAIAAALVFVAMRDTTSTDAATATSTAALQSTTAATPDTTSPFAETTSTIPTDTTAPPDTLPPGATACDPYTTITAAGAVANPELVEASGMAASRTRPGVLWSHNDSRDGARVYAIGADGADLGGFDIAGALAFDWEDMAAGPGSDPTTSMLYLGDIGDNFSIRDGRITVYRVPEPDPASLAGSIEGSVALEYTYPDGVYNAEAMFVSDGAVFIATKDQKDARIYRGDATGDGSSIETLELVAVLSLGAEVTAADVSWDGTTIVFRGYRTVWMWHRPPGGTVADALATEPCQAPSPEEVQGESIAFLADGTYATVSEGSNPNLFLIARDS